MSTAAPDSADSIGIPPFPVRKFTVSEYRQMGQVGLLSIDDRVELLEGWIVPKMNHNPAHDLAVMLIEQELRRRLPPNLLVRVQMPITTGDSEPEPDVAVVSGPIRKYGSSHPTGADVKLVVGVADSSVARDRQKCRLYARSGLQEYWIVNLQKRRIEVYSDTIALSAGEPGYQSRVEYLETEFIPLNLREDGKQFVAVADLLP